MKKTKKISISAVLSALSVVVIYLGAVFDVLDLTACAIASIAIVFAQIELKGYYPYLIYASVSIISLLILPQKFSAMLYVCFGGIYPMIKKYAEKYPGARCLIIKIIGFALIMTVSVLLLLFVFLTPTAELFSLYYLAVLLLCAVTFFLYDYALTLMIAFYFHRLRKKIQRYLK